MSIPKLTIVYFGIGGRAEPIRLAAAIGRIPFTNKSVKFKDFPELKKTLPLGQLPVLEIEEEGKEMVTLTQSMAILRYFGKLGGLYPEDPVEATKVDSMIDVIADATQAVELTFAGAVRSFVSDTEWTPEEKLAIRARYVANGMPKYFNFLQKIIAENGSGWLVGNGVTIADLRLYQALTPIKTGILDGVPPSTLDAYPGLLKHMEKIETLPQVVEFNEKHPKPYADFEYVAN